VHGRIVLPGASLVELACAAAMQTAGTRGRSAADGRGSVVCLEGFTIERPVVAVDTRDGDATKSTRLFCVLGDEGSVEVYGEDAQGGKVLHAEGTVVLSSSGTQTRQSVKSARRADSSTGGAAEPDWAALSRAAEHAQGECLLEVDAASVYAQFARSGLPYGETFRLMQSGRVSADGLSCVTTMRLDAVWPLRESYTVPPPLIDAVFQSGLLCAARGQAPQSTPGDGELSASSVVPKVPFSFDRVWLRPGEAASLWQSQESTVHIEMKSETSAMVVFDCSLLNSAGEVVMRAEGVHARAIQMGALDGEDDADASLADGAARGETEGEGAEEIVPAAQLMARWVESEGVVDGASIAQSTSQEGDVMVSRPVAPPVWVRRCLLIGSRTACAAAQEAVASLGVQEGDVRVHADVLDMERWMLLRGKRHLHAGSVALCEAVDAAADAATEEAEASLSEAGSEEREEAAEIVANTFFEKGSYDVVVLCGVGEGLAALNGSSFGLGSEYVEQWLNLLAFAC